MKPKHPLSRASDRFKARLYDLAFNSDMKAVRLLLATGAILTGLSFLWPVHVFPTTDQLITGHGRHTYAIMAQIADEWVWGVAFLLQGSVMLWSLLADYRSRWLLWLDAAFGSVLWTVAVGACYLAYWPGIEQVLSYRPPKIMGAEISASIASWWTFVRYSFQTDKNG